MRGKITIALLLTVILGLNAGCMSGPFKLARSWDDKRNELYSRDAWIHGALLQDILPVYPSVGLFAAIGDTLFVNPYYFWGTDAWADGGTAFIHKNPIVGPEHSVESLTGKK